MKCIEMNDLEIVGMNGAPLVECGRSLPVARRKSDGFHCVLQIPKDDEPISFETPEEAESYAATGRWTKIQGTIQIPRSCFSGDSAGFTHQPMMIFADDKLLDQADRLPRPGSFNGERLVWRRLDGYDESIHAACCSEETSARLLDEWSQLLMKRFNAWYYYHRDQDYLKRLADFALCAAISRGLRWKAYLRFALVQEPEKIRRTFDAFTLREFPDASWERYKEEIKDLNDFLNNRTPFEHLSVEKSDDTSTESKLRGIARVAPDDAPTKAVA
jgi:hypothetical protein